MTDTSDIKHKFISGIAWGIAEKFANLFTGFIITLVLARLLTPADYGLVNMIYIFTVLGTVLLDGGFGQALIQRKDVNKLEITSVFYLNLLLSIAVYLILYISAPAIAAFYHQPRLIEISRVVFLTLPINAFCIVQHSLLTKELKVQQLTYVSIISAIVSGALGIIMACKGFGVWSLVIQSLSYQATRALSLWFFSKWRPCIGFSFSFIKSIFGFSMNLLGVFTLTSIFQNIYTLLIGRFYNVNEVGYYNQAYRMQTVASNAIASSIQRVTFPTFAKFQDDYVLLRSAYKRVTVTTMYIYFPLMMFLIVISKALFDVFLTEKWLPSVPLFCLLCLAESLYPLNNINASVLKAVGKGKKYFRLTIANYLIITISIIFTYTHGIYALLSGYAVSAVLMSVMSMTVCGNEIKYPLYVQLKDLSPILIITAATCIAAYLVTKLPCDEIYQLILSLISGFLMYIIANRVLRTPLYMELHSLIKNKK